MAEKPKGNFIYEILIVILTLALLGTILYPSKVWKKEDTQEKICRARMSAIQQFEFQYVTKTNMYADSLPLLKQVVMSDSELVMATDTLVQWDNLVSSNDLKQLVNEKQFPKVLNQYIHSRLESEYPLGSLGKWDSLEYKLINTFKEKIPDLSLDEDTKAFDENVDWRKMVGENVFWDILFYIEMPKRTKNRTQNDAMKDISIIETSGWSYLKPVFYDSLKSFIRKAEMINIWEKENQDAWEKEKRASWEAEMDSLPQGEQDSLWNDYKRKLWDEKYKDLTWKKERKALWKTERKEWTENNQEDWTRNVLQKWESERKASWIKEIKADIQAQVQLWKNAIVEDTLSQPETEIVEDTTVVDTIVIAQSFFEAKKDSIWRDVKTALQEQELDDWKKQNRQYISEMIEGLWSTEKLISWEPDGYARWIEKKEKDRKRLWIDLKEEIWNMKKPEFWRREDLKRERKNSALRRLDHAIAWKRIIGAEKTNAIVDQLQLPDNESLTKMIKARRKKEILALPDMGIVGLFRDNLVDSIFVCPTANAPYLVHVVDSTKQFSIYCPIMITDFERAPGDTVRNIPVFRIVNNTTNDTTKTPLSISTLDRVLGGGSIKHHGNIDADGKKSWEKRGSG